MAGIIARAYANCIKRGIRAIEDVRPDKLKNEVKELLIAEGLYELAGEKDPNKETPKDDNKEEDPPTETPKDDANTENKDGK